MLKESQFNYFCTYLLAHEAESRGIKVSKPFTKGIFAKRSLIILKYKKHAEVIVGQRTSHISVNAYWIQKDKYVTKYFLHQAGIKTAPGEAFKISDRPSIFRFIKHIGFPVVIKQLGGTHGDLVFVGISSKAAVEKTLKSIAAKRKDLVLVEKEFQGQEYRLMATKDKFLAATHRIPANVIGDGVSNIKKLIKEKNSDPRRGEGHRKSLIKIEVDAAVKDYLQGQKLSSQSIPAKGRQVFLRPNSNLSTGGDSIDVTDEIHPAVKKIAVKAIRAIPGLAYGGIDYMTKDVTQKPNTRNYIIIEINDSPMISMHHIPYQGKSRDVAKEIIDLLFPETKKR